VKGSSNTILVVETTIGVARMSPDDLPVKALAHGIIPVNGGIQSVGSFHQDGTNILFADGSFDFFKWSKTSEDIAELQKKCQINDQQK